MSKLKAKKQKENQPKILPPLGDFRVEVKGGKRGEYRVLVCACDAILAYSHELVAFRHGESYVALYGEELWCRTWGNRVAEVTGKVGRVLLGEGVFPCES